MTISFFKEVSFKPNFKSRDGVSLLYLDREMVPQQGGLLAKCSTSILRAEHATEANERALAELSYLLNRLSARLDPTAPPASSVPASAPVILQQDPEPERYKGNPESCDAFVVNCSLLFSLQPRTFATEAAKVAYTITHLTGRAWLWGTAEWERQSEACSTFSAFAAELRKVFGQGNSRSSAGHRLLALRQGERSVLDYSIDFHTLARDALPLSLGLPVAPPTQPATQLGDRGDPGVGSRLSPVLSSASPEVDLGS
uniref:DUF4939 domain-containing protein n=1 Tax=Takifugu rubripes TaxID=31033 RepID=A0A674PID6_TAKRU